VDILCEEGKMSHNHCLKCGSHRTAPMGRFFISHSSILELQFLFQHVLPVTGRLVGYLYSSAARLVGVEISAEFIRLQNMAVEKYGFSDRIQINTFVTSLLSWGGRYPSG
uniref:Zgc:109986 n=1 Tax=Oncorhynchus tshawytscha TaxID=74940 RepID=A0AAZ3R2T4_ONCTS